MAEGVYTDNRPNFADPFIVRWDQSEAQVFGLDEIIEQANSPLIIFDDASFTPPIERATIGIKRIPLEGSETGLHLEASIQMDRTLNGYSRLAASAVSHSHHYRDVFGHFRQEESIFGNHVHRVVSEKGSRFVIWYEKDSGKIHVTNFASLTGGAKEEKVSPRPEHITDTADQVGSFLELFMRTMNYARGTTHHRNYLDLARPYIIGQNRRSGFPGSAATATTKPNVRWSQVSAPKLESKEDEHRNTTDTTDAADIDTADDILSTIEFERPDGRVTLDDVGGLERVKDSLREVALSFTHPEVMAKWGAKRPSGVLLYGEPGTGKTMLVHALASEIGATVWEIKSNEIYLKWLGESETKIRELFNRARAVTEPTIVFFDEFDAIVGITEEPRPGGADNARNSVAGIFKQEMNTLAEQNPNVLIVATTNDLDRIHPALIRSGRMDIRIYVPMPDDSARSQIIGNTIAKALTSAEGTDFVPFADDIDVPAIVSATDGMSGADIAEIFRRVNMTKAMLDARGLGVLPISQADITEKIEDFRRNG